MTPIDVHRLTQDERFHLAHECLRKLPAELQVQAIIKAVPDAGARDKIAEAIEA